MRILHDIFILVEDSVFISQLSDVMSYALIALRKKFYQLPGVIAVLSSAIRHLPILTEGLLIFSTPVEYFNNRAIVSDYPPVMLFFKF